MNSSTSADKKHPPLNQRLSFWLAILVVVVAVIALRYLFAGTPKQQRSPSVPVVVAKARSMDVPVTFPALGAVTPTATVTVHTQINGQLMQVLFREGQLVKKGGLLAQIDPRPYEAQLLQNEGQLARDQALLANARIDLKRYQKLWSQDSVSRQTLDTQISLVKQDEGTVKLDQGLVASTRVNLAYCRITSPVDGRVGLRLVDPGNFVQTSDATGIAVLNTINPITVIFTIPEDNIQTVLQKLNAKQQLVTKAYDRAQTKLLATGTVLTIDNQIDPTTGTVKLKAQFKNDNNILFPSQFVNIQLLIDTLHNATVIPTAAIQYGAGNSTFVYAYNQDNTVSMKPVVVGVAAGEDTAITSGIAPEESVVIEGADKLTDGATVTLPGMNPSPVGKKAKRKK